MLWLGTDLLTGMNSQMVAIVSARRRVASFKKSMLLDAFGGFQNWFVKLDDYTTQCYSVSGDCNHGYNMQQQTTYGRMGYSQSFLLR